MMFAQHDIDQAHFTFMPSWMVVAWVVVVVLLIVTIALLLIQTRRANDLAEKWRARDERDGPRGPFTLALVLWIAIAIGLPAQQPNQPTAAVCRLWSHGGSGTVIKTGPGYSFVLTCRHLFTDRGDRIDTSLCRKPMSFDVPVPTQGQARQVGSRVLGIADGGDIALVLLNAGPLPYVAPVAPRGFRPGPCLSVGYDGMTLPPHIRPATILSADATTTWTQGAPWHGRSGGALIDQKTGYLVGVVSGYEVTPRGPGRGIYASHEGICNFLDRVPEYRAAFPQTQEPPLLAPQFPPAWQQPRTQPRPIYAPPRPAPGGC